MLCSIRVQSIAYLPIQYKQSYEQYCILVVVFLLYWIVPYFKRVEAHAGTRVARAVDRTQRFSALSIPELEQCAAAREHVLARLRLRVLMIDRVDRMLHAHTQIIHEYLIDPRKKSG